MAELNSITSEQQPQDKNQYKHDLNYGEWSQEQMLRFMEEFEQSKRKRNRKRIEKAQESDGDVY